MSDSDAPRSYDTVIIPAALVFPGDTPPYIGPDAARIPVRVVWHPADPPAPPATGGGSASFRNGTPTARTAGDPAADDAPPDAAAAPAPERPPSGDRSPVDPVARFLKVNEALDRIAEAAASVTQGAAVSATSGTDVRDPTAPVPVVDDDGVPIEGAQGAMMRPASLPPQIFINQGLADRNDVRRIFKPDGASQEGISSLHVRPDQ
jgi:hypothetical protein